MRSRGDAGGLRKHPAWRAHRAAISLAFETERAGSWFPRFARTGSSTKPAAPFPKPSQQSFSYRQSFSYNEGCRAVVLYSEGGRVSLPVSYGLAQLFPTLACAHELLFNTKASSPPTTHASLARSLSFHGRSHLRPDGSRERLTEQEL